MGLLSFYKDFPDEQSCKLHFKKFRDSAGVTCKKCGGSTHYWKQDKWQYECKHCRFRTTLRSGTVMHGSKLSFQYWYIAIHLLSATKKSFSAKEIQRQLGHKRYQPVWEMLHKIRAVMGLRDGEYKIGGDIEIDEGFYESILQNSDNEVLKRGRGSQKQTKVFVMAESKAVEKPRKNRPAKKVGFLKMKVIKNLKSDTMDCMVKQNINPDSRVSSDAYPSYNGIKELVKEHKAEVIKPKDAGKILPWVHIAISNSKRMFLDIYHKIDSDFMQNYLNEFCYKFNRRYFGDRLFERLVIAGVNYKWNQL